MNSYCADVASRGSLDLVVRVANEDRLCLRAIRFSARLGRNFDGTGDSLIIKEECVCVCVCAR
jgi:hypothetical protein